MLVFFMELTDVELDSTMTLFLAEIPYISPLISHSDLFLDLHFVYSSLV
jgi:hypothetical protein